MAPPSLPPASTLFVSHGAPTLIIDNNPTRDFLRNLGRSLPRPKGILAVSAHWTTGEPTVSLAARPETIHDFYGFPPEMYKQTYPAPGAPELAKRTSDALQSAGISCHTHPSRGLDHGAWVPLKLMFPDADIPVAQLSVQPSRSAAEHYQMGRALAPLAKEGFLVIGSGSATHNLGDVVWMEGETPPNRVAGWAREFDDWLRRSLVSGRFDDVCDYLTKGPNAKRAHPTPEHFIPLLVAAGAAGDAARAKSLHESFTFGTLSMGAYRFTPSITAEL